MCDHHQKNKNKNAYTGYEGYVHRSLNQKLKCNGKLTKAILTTKVIQQGDLFLNIIMDKIIKTAKYMNRLRLDTSKINSFFFVMPIQRAFLNSLFA